MRQFAIRLALRKLRRSRPKTDRKKIDTVLRDNDLLGLVYAALEEEGDALGLGGDAPVLEFFQWLITYVMENPEGIMQLIAMIITLFAANEEDPLG